MTDVDDRPTVAFLMLAHEGPKLCARLAQRLLRRNTSLVIHLDATSDDTFIEAFERALGPDSRNVVWAERIAVKWGDWSMVEATLNGLRAIDAFETPPDFVYLLSGSDYPIRPLSQLFDYLARHPDQDFIECRNAEQDHWIADGIQRERYQYRHWVSWRRHPRTFSALLRLQQRLGLKRRFPEGLHPHIGSQWWALRWNTCRELLGLAGQRRIRRFFRRVHIPDELFFQTLVASIVPPGEVSGFSLTHCIFSDLGAPIVFYDGHEEVLSRQPFFFARKLSPHASRLRDGLDRTAGSGGIEMADEAMIGQRTGDYEQFVTRHSHGLRGRRSWGNPGRAALGELERNDRRYFLLISDDRQRLEAARGALTEWPQVTCHGELFGPTRIEFGDDVGTLLGYGTDDLSMRDQDRPAFLADVLRLAGNRHTFFCWHRTPGAGDAEVDPDTTAWLDVLIADPNCVLLDLDSSSSDPRDAEAWSRTVETMLTSVEDTRHDVVNS